MKWGFTIIISNENDSHWKRIINPIKCVLYHEFMALYVPSASSGYYITCYQIDGRFRFLIVVKGNRCSSLYSKTHWTEWCHGNACRTLAHRLCAGGFIMSLEPGYGIRIDSSKFMRLSVEFKPFWSYVKNPEKYNSSLLEYHTSKSFQPIADHSGTSRRILEQINKPELEYPEECPRLDSKN